AALSRTVILRPSVGRRISRNARNLNALSWLFGQEPGFDLFLTYNYAQTTGGKARTVHGRPRDLREILRPTEGLRMTVLMLRRTISRAMAPDFAKCNLVSHAVLTKLKLSTAIFLLPKSHSRVILNHLLTKGRPIGRLCKQNAKRATVTR